MTAEANERPAVTKENALSYLGIKENDATRVAAFQTKVNTELKNQYPNPPKLLTVSGKVDHDTIDVAYGIALLKHGQRLSALAVNTNHEDIKARLSAEADQCKKNGNDSIRSALGVDDLNVSHFAYHEHDRYIINMSLEPHKDTVKALLLAAGVGDIHSPEGAPLQPLQGSATGPRRLG